MRHQPRHPFRPEFAHLLKIFAAALLATSVLTAPAFAADKIKLEREADLPRFTYPVKGDLVQFIKDDAAFGAFTGAVGKDLDGVLDRYEIDDKSTLKDLLGRRLLIEFLDGKYDAVLATIEQIRALEDKPADKLVVGLQIGTIAKARLDGLKPGTPEYDTTIGKALSDKLAALPYNVVENEVKEAKVGAELIGETLILGRVREVLQPIVDKSGSLSSDLAPGLINARFRLEAVLPLKSVLVTAYQTYLDAHKVTKPDIWAARDKALPAGRKWQPVDIGIWDSGSDLSLFQDRLVGGKTPTLIAFDKYSKPATGYLMPVPAAYQPKLAEIKAREKGFGDLEANIDSPEASEVKQYLSSLSPGDYKSGIEQLSFGGNYIHGTHVAGIATAGNPYARLAVARIEFSYTLRPDPCPSQELTDRSVKANAAYVAFFKQHHIRVVNMSWGGDVASYEHDLEQCGLGGDAAGRKALARHYFDEEKAGLTAAMKSAPDILFVAAAGNSDQDASFAESIPAGIALPNLISVGAVDRAGDEASFTSYGPTVKVHADGYLVDSVIPGGEHVALSGTSMAAPQVTNLAAKLITVDPKLKPAQVIKLIVDTSDATADGRRHLINPKKALAELKVAE
jgi:hypothetical protein